MKKRLFLYLFLAMSLQSRSQDIKQLSDSLLFYYQAKSPEKATPFAEQLVTLIKQKYGTDNKIYSSYLTLLAGLYFSNTSLVKAEQAFLELKAVNAKVLGTNSDDYIKGINMLAVTYNRTGQDDKAVPLLTESLVYYASRYTDSSYEYAAAANKLSRVYESLGEYEKSLPLEEKAMAITAKTKGANSAEYATIINNMGLLYKNLGRPEKAEPLLLRSAAIRKSVAGEADPDYANSLNNLAVFYAGIDQLAKATAYYSQAASVYRLANGEGSFEYLTCLGNLAGAYGDAGAYDKAEQTYQDALTIAQKKYNEEWPLYRELMRSLGQLYLYMNQYDKAEPLLIKAAAAEKVKNEKGDDYAAALNDLAFLYNHTGRKQEAEKTYIQSANLLKDALGENHPQYITALNNLSLLYQAQHRYSEAVPLRMKITAASLTYFVKLFAVLSESEKLAYIDRIALLQNGNLDLLYLYPSAPAAYCTDIFNTQLFLKSLLLEDSKNVLEAVRESRDTVLRRQFNEWQKDKKALAKEYALPENSRSTDLVKLEEETESKEKELVRASAAFRNLRKGLDIKLQDIQVQLNKDEATVEFVNFNTGNEEGDSVIYAAFVLRKTDSVPRFIPLFEEQQLTSRIGYLGKTSKVVVNMLYPGKGETGYNAGAPSRQLYRLLWLPLEDYLTGVKKIYYSPTGKLYNIAFPALVADSNRLLSDKYSLQQLTNIKFAGEEKQSLKNEFPSGIALFGDARFSMDSASLVYYYKQSPVPARPLKEKQAADNNPGGPWPGLPGTKDEVNGIAQLFIKNKAGARLYTGINASEQNLKLLGKNAPEVLFIATHGFFLPPPDTKKQQAGLQRANVFARTANPLMRSGLVLSGGNYAWSGKKPVDGIEDGVVTAYEISQLNLDHTGLAVLSACETGLGDIKGTEGVFGLQRAFKIAGVKKMIVSLWKVPDKETAELMKSFFLYWQSGKTLAEAFSAAQADMRLKYPPYYWAAFILVE